MSSKNRFLTGAMSLCMTLAAPIVEAETFAVSLSKVNLGQLTYAGTPSSATLNATLSNTPLGVFDGTFNGTSKPATSSDGKPAIEYTALSKSSRKSRKVQVEIAAGRAITTNVAPTSEATALSDPTQAPQNITDPARAIGLLINASGCPARVNIYDGRRAIALIPQGTETKDGMLICKIAYKVTAGPGHLSPLKISKAKMQVTYNTANGQSIAQISLGSGPFNLVLERTE